MSVYKFKSSGNTFQSINRLTKSVVRTQQPIGIATPLRLGDDGLFSMHYNNVDQIHDNLRNLLLTNWGERLGSYYFGANLKPLTSEVSTIDAFEDEAIERIRAAVSKWMPYVTLKNFISNFDNQENINVGILKFAITYSVPRISVEDKSLQISLYLV